MHDPACIPFGGHIFEGRQPCDIIGAAQVMQAQRPRDSANLLIDGRKPIGIATGGQIAVAVTIARAVELFGIAVFECAGRGFAAFEIKAFVGADNIVV